MNGLPHPCYLNEFILILEASGLRFDFNFIIENHLSKQNSPRWDAAFCGITFGATVFAYVS